MQEINLCIILLKHHWDVRNFKINILGEELINQFGVKFMLVIDLLENRQDGKGSLMYVLPCMHVIPSMFDPF